MAFSKASTVGPKALPHPAAFTPGAIGDKKAVIAAATRPWSNTQTMSQIAKLKPVKRQMDVRANPDPLRARLTSVAG
ncbi:MAG: hypothetical protein ACOH2H_13545 [Cypionkella sp.]